MLTSTVKTGWRTISVVGPEDTRLLAAYSSEQGTHTVVGLDTAGAQLNTVSPTLVSYTIGGLPPSRQFALTVWNAAGDGLVALATQASTDASGVVTIQAPQNAVFALSG
jgi:hypothetical protein